jgi:hypothetical protein
MSLILPGLDIVGFNKINYYTPADFVDRGRSWAALSYPHSPGLKVAADFINKKSK